MVCTGVFEWTFKAVSVMFFSALNAGLWPLSPGDECVCE